MASRKHINRITLISAALAGCAFALVSLLSFNISDWPNPDVAPHGKVANLCGPAGAYIAYHFSYYLGPAGIPLLVALTIWLILRCMHKPVEQLFLRAIGVTLVVAVISTAAYLSRPGGAESLSHGNGGVLGIAVGHFLLANAAMTGAVLILLAALVVGLLLAADNVLLMLPQLLMRFSERLGRAGPVLAGVGALGRAATMLGQERVAARHSPNLDEPHEAAGDSLLVDEPAEDASETTDDDESTEQHPGDADAADAERTSVLSSVSTALAHLRGRAANQPQSADSAEDFRDYEFPPIDLLEEPTSGYSAIQEKVVQQKAQVLQQTLKEFNLNTDVVAWDTGPVITMFELSLAPGIKVSQISNLSNDLARSLGVGAVRVVAPIPGKHTIGIEVPNSEKEKVRIKELLQVSRKKTAKMHIPLFLGKDASGAPLIVDLTALPHCLIAGTTGSGKSVCLNSIIMSILLTQRPDIVKLIIVDPKMVEMNAFRDIAHLMCPIVTEMKKAEQMLEWLTVKMDERYSLLAEARVKNIAGYNELPCEDIYERFCPGSDEEKAKIPLQLPYIVVVIDELADLMMTSAKEVEGHIIRLAQKSRAVGIHIVLATQRPQATVVTGLIKSNLPSRISFRVAARMDSRIVLDQNGAEALLGQGDMLFLQPGTSDMSRAQGTFVSDDEVHRLVKHLKSVAKPSYHTELIQLNQADAESGERDELFDEAVRIVLQTKRGSVSLLQRRLTIGYSRASRLIDQMAIAGIVGEYKGSQAREVLITPAEYEVVRRQMLRDEDAGYADLADEQIVEGPQGAGSAQAAAADPAGHSPQTPTPEPDDAAQTDDSEDSDLEDDDADEYDDDYEYEEEEEEEGDEEQQHEDTDEQEDEEQGEPRHAR